MAALLVLVAFAYLLLRVGSGREALRDPARRASTVLPGPGRRRRSSPAWPSRWGSPTAG